MGTLKDEKDVIVGSTKEKIGELMNNKEMEQEGKEQADQAKAKKEQRQKRVDEIEAQQEESTKQSADTLGRDRLLNENENSDAAKIPASERRDADQLKHYTGIEDKL
jgi:uncharacterized protein YjbJ (UPF0337 family)